MKKIVILWIAIAIVANARELTIEEASKLRGYNHSFSGKLKQQRAMKRVSKIDRKRAYAIGRSICKSKNLYGKLKMRNQRLFYDLHSKNCSVKVDALDGSIVGVVR